MQVNRLDRSKTAKDAKGIFSITEILSPRQLPSVKSSHKIGYKTQLRPSKSSWESFLQSNINTGNLSPKNISISTREIFSKIEDKIKQESINNSISVVKPKIPIKELESFRELVLFKKSAFNKIHHKVQTKQELLASLLDKLDEMNMNDTAAKNESLLDTRLNECLEVELGLKNELFIKETLLHMIDRLKKENVSKTGPIIEIRKKLAEVKQKYLTLQNGLAVIRSNISELSSQSNEEALMNDALIVQKNLLIAETSKSYENKVRLKTAVDLQKFKNQALEKQKHDIKKLKDLESRLDTFKNVQLLEEEILSIDNFCTTEEEKFKTIQKVTNIRFVGDILSHYEYLMDNKQKLMLSVKVALGQLERLSSERVQLSEELNEMRFQDDHEWFEEKDFSEIGKSIQVKAKSMENYESRIEKLEEIIIMAINTFARVNRLMGVHSKSNEIKFENLMDLMKNCTNSLEGFIEDAKLKEYSSSSKSLDLSFSETNSFKFHLKY